MSLTWTRDHKSHDGRFWCYKPPRADEWRLYDSNDKDDRGNTNYTLHRYLKDAKAAAEGRLRKEREAEKAATDAAYDRACTCLPEIEAAAARRRPEPEEPPAPAPVPAPAANRKTKKNDPPVEPVEPPPAKAKKDKGKPARKPRKPGNAAAAPAAPEKPAVDVDATLAELVWRHGNNLRRRADRDEILSAAGLSAADLTALHWDRAAEALKDRLAEKLRNPVLRWGKPATKSYPDGTHAEVWETECGLYRVGRLGGSEPRFVAAAKASGPSKEAPINGEFKRLDAAFDAVERYHAKHGGHAAVESNEREALREAKAAGLHRRPRADGDDAAPGAAKEKKRQEAAGGRPPRAGGPSVKEQVYRAWKAGPDKPDPDALLAAVGGAVKLTSIKSWLSAWRRGQNLPGCARGEST